LENFTLACPCERGSIPDDYICIDEYPGLSKLKFVDLPFSKGLLDVFKHLPRTIYLLSRAITVSEVVQVSVAGRPIPYAWFIVLIMKLYKKKFLLINVESAVWRLRKGIHLTIKGVIRAKIVELLNHYCINQTDLAFFTQEEYKRSLMTKNPSKGYIIHASWVDEKVMISEAEVLESWDNKLRMKSNKLRLLFAGRLLASKGILILINAMKTLSSRNVPIQLDILGEGRLQEQCEKMIQEISGSIEVHLLGTMPYNLEFHRKIQDYHAVIIPSLSDEQPRIVYDSYSQGVPVLASSTPGLRECVKNESTGILFSPNNVDDLAACIESVWIGGLHKLLKMGVMAHKEAIGMTHSNMHKKRSILLSQALDGNQMSTADH